MLASDQNVNIYGSSTSSRDSQKSSQLQHTTHFPGNALAVHPAHYMSYLCKASIVDHLYMSSSSSRYKLSLSSRLISLGVSF